MERPEIPQAISTAIMSMLEPYFPRLTATRLVSAIAFEPEQDQPEKLYDRRETATALHVSTVSVDRLLKEGGLTRIRVRGRVFVRKSEIDRIINGEKQTVQK